eukprot:m.116686 g.116686  ORF g.116686 m.116686 type:complete len:778 (-) comp14473_c0_seq2:73-2406(-)
MAANPPIPPPEHAAGCLTTHLLPEECHTGSCIQLTHYRGLIRNFSGKLAEFSYAGSRGGPPLKPLWELQRKQFYDRTKVIAETISRSFSSQFFPTDFGMQLVCCVFARSNPATGQLELHEGRFQSLFPLYFEPETGEGGQVAPRRILLNRLANHPQHKSLHQVIENIAPIVRATEQAAATHAEEHPHAGGASAPSDAPAEALTEKLAFMNTINLVSKQAEESIRRLLKQPFPKTTLLRQAHRKLSHCIPIQHHPTANCAWRLLSDILRFIHGASLHFRQAIAALGEQPLPILLHADGGKIAKHSGQVCFSAKIMVAWAAHLSLDSVFAELPLGILWTESEDAGEIDAAFAPIEADCALLEREGLNLGGGRTLRIRYTSSCDYKMTEELAGEAGNDCIGCNTPLSVIKADRTQAREYTLRVESFPPATSVLTARLVPQRINSLPDILHLAKGVLTSLLKPIFHIALHNEEVLDRLVRNVRQGGFPSFHFNRSTTGVVSPPSLDVRQLRKIFCFLNVDYVLGEAETKGQIASLERTFKLVDDLLRVLHVGGIAPDAYKAQAHAAQRAFRFSHLNDGMTKYMHMLFDHIHEYLAAHGTIYQASMESLEAAIGRIKAVFHHATLHCGFGAESILPALTQVMHNFNATLWGYAYGIVTPGETIPKPRPRHRKHHHNAGHDSDEDDDGDSHDEGHQGDGSGAGPAEDPPPAPEAHSWQSRQPIAHPEATPTKPELAAALQQPSVVSPGRPALKRKAGEAVDDATRARRPGRGAQTTDADDDDD